TGRGARLRSARDVNAYFRRFAAFHLVPFGRGGDQFPVAVAAGDVGNQGRWQGRRLLDLLAAPRDRAFVREFAQQLLQLHPVGILQTELTGDLARSDLSRMRADESDDDVPAGKFAVTLPGHLSACLARALFRDRLCNLR